MKDLTENWYVDKNSYPWLAAELLIFLAYQQRGEIQLVRLIRWFFSDLP